MPAKSLSAKPSFLQPSVIHLIHIKLLCALKYGHNLPFFPSSSSGLSIFPMETGHNVSEVTLFLSETLNVIGRVIFHKIPKEKLSHEALIMAELLLSLSSWRLRSSPPLVCQDLICSVAISRAISFSTSLYNSLICQGLPLCINSDRISKIL